MRITGGEWRGRRILAPPGKNMRPTQGRVREALFSILAPRLTGAVFVDLYAGTGVVGLEALSRGAVRVTWIEHDRNVFDVLQANVAALAGAARRDTARAVCEDVGRWVRRAADGPPADIVFADPPYALEFDWMETLRASRVLAPGGRLVLERPAGAPAPAPAGWRCERDRCYGRTRLMVWMRDEEDHHASTGGVSGDL